MQDFDSNLLKSCDFFDGKWVRDDGLPYYPPGSCPYIDRDFINGRPEKVFIDGNGRLAAIWV